MENPPGNLFSKPKSRARHRKSKSNDFDDVESLNSMNTLGFFSAPDDLSLKLTDIDDVASELMNFDAQTTRENVDEETKDENIRLRKLLGEKDNEIKLLKKKVTETEAEFVGNLAADVAATKIVELSRKIRELTAELESERTKNKQLSKNIYDLENTNQQVTKLESKIGGSSKTVENELPNGELLQEKLNLANTKLAEYRNNCQTLKKELKIAQRALAQEIGDCNSTQAALGGIGWRGRAQQIMSLQNKLSELRAQLDKEREKRQETDSNSTEIQTQLQTYTIDDKQKEQIKKIEKDRKDEREKVVLELKSLEKEMQQTKEKLEASKARIRILNNEIQKLKAKISALTTKGEHDDELIKAFTDQLTKLQQTQQQLDSIRINEIEVGKLNAQHEEESERLKRIINDREEQVLQLQKELDHIKQRRTESRGHSSLQAPNSAPISRASINSVEEYPRNVFNAQEVRNGLLPQLKSDDHDRANEISELQTMCHEYRTVAQAAQVEKEKLLELVTVLNKRVEDATSQVVQSQQRLHEIQLKNVQLEKQKEKATLESAKGTGGATNRRSSLPPTRATNSEGSNLTELRNNVQALKEEKELLQTALENILKAKDDDLKAYREIMTHAQQIFIDGMRRNND